MASCLVVEILEADYGNDSSTLSTSLSADDPVISPIFYYLVRIMSSYIHSLSSTYLTKYLYWQQLAQESLVRHF